MIHAIEIDHARDPEKFVPLYPLANNAFDTQCLLSVNTLLLLPLIFKFLGLSPRLCKVRRRPSRTSAAPPTFAAPSPPSSASVPAPACDANVPVRKRRCNTRVLS